MAAKKSKTVKKAVTAKKKPAAAKKKPAVAKRAVTAKKSATAKKKPAAAKKAAPLKKKPASAKKKPVAQTEMERLLEAADRLEETLLDMDPDDSELDLTLEDLEQVLREVLRLDPSNVATMIRLGEFFLDRNGAEDLALEYFEQAFTLQPGDKKLAKLIKKAKAQLAEN
ncbi:hypothetical protein [Pyxidicoccus trucidator]|uniref:hypothetical protein n=1 Tax=Pyxidicoccus trucidator TaxID=2709662 RepID=UPI0013D9D518|nr:hypothetical protein [Pyxidicoccus trucidator]